MPRALWIGGRITAPIYLTEPQPLRPDLIVLMDAGTGRILQGDVSEPTESAATLARCLSRALSEVGPKSQPARIRVADAVLADALRTLAGEGTAIEIGPTPELALVAEGLSDFLESRASEFEGEDREPESYFEGGRVSPETVARLFDSAARLYRIAPWKLLGDAHVIGLDLPEYDLQRAVLSIIGAGGQSFGFIVFDSAEDYDAFIDAGQSFLDGGRDLGASMLSLNFESRSKIAVTMRAELKQHRWAVAGPKAYPYVMGIDRDRVTRPLQERDVRLVCAVAEGLARFFTKHQHYLLPDLSKEIIEDYSLDVGEPLNLRLTAPHPETPWLSDDDPLDLESDDDPLDDDEEDGAGDPAGEIVNAFVLDQRAAGRPESWLAAAGFVSWSLLRYKADYAGGTFDSLDDGDALEYLLDHFPRKVSGGEDVMVPAPDIVMEFYDWLAARGTIPAKTAAAVRERMPSTRKRFLAAARDPSRFGPAKSFVMKMRADDVDTSDEVAVQAYMLRHTLERLDAAEGSRVAVADDGARGQGGDRRSARWVPDSDAAPADPKAPCPCGSGKAYRKCCRPR